MLKNVLNLELSSGCFSTGASAGVAALEVSLELTAELVAEPGRVFSGARSAMACEMCAFLSVSRVRMLRAYIQVQRRRQWCGQVLRRCASRDALYLARGKALT